MMIDRWIGSSVIETSVRVEHDAAGDNGGVMTTEYEVPAAGSDGPFDAPRATRRVRQMVPPGPSVTERQARKLTDSIRSAMTRSPELVAEVTGLDDAAMTMAQIPQLVVDRPGWAQVNIEMFTDLTRQAPTLLGNRLTTLALPEQVAAALALLGSRVLGQYQPFTRRLVMVAPNILRVQRDLALSPPDFHLWVSAHEATHGVQFAAAPWLRGWMMDRLVAVLSGLDSSEVATGLRRVGGAESQSGETGVDHRTADGRDTGKSGLEDLVGEDRASSEPSTRGGATAQLSRVLDEPSRDALDQVVALMTLLEGHADVVMDEVGPRHIRTVKTIRRRFDQRRASKRPLVRLLNRLIGMDDKLEQYRRGAAFTRSVVDEVGHGGFNAVFTDAENLPRLVEIDDPGAWIRRVHQ